MIEDGELEKLKQLVELMEPGAELVRAWPLLGGISATMRALEIKIPGGNVEKIISRRPGSWSLAERPHAAARDFHMLKTLGKLGLPVPKAILLDDEPLIFSEPSLVMELVDAAPEYDPKDLTDYVEQVASLMLRIQRTPLEAFGDLPRTWEVRTRRMANSPSVLDEAQGEAEIRDVLKAAMKTRGPGPQVLMHADIWPGNLLWRDGEIVCIIDWEDAEIGNPLWDVAVTRSELLFAFGLEAMEGFTAAIVRISDIDFADLAFWDLCAALRPMNNFATWAGAWPGLGRFDVTEAGMRAKHLEFVAQAMENLKP